MPVTEFECAIAKSQIGRYISGENLGGEVVRQLESHIGVCAKCKKVLEDRRKELVSMLETSEDQIVATPKAMISPIEIQIPETVAATAPIEEPVAYAPDLKAILRDKLAAQLAKAPQPAVIEVPVVAPAFAHKDETNPETVSVYVGASQEAKATPKPKLNLNLNAFALFRRVPEESETNAPAISTENLKAAKESFKANNPTLRKPMLYAAGLAVVVAGMSFVVKDPTSLLGPKANTSLLVNKAKPSSQIKKTTKKSKESQIGKRSNSAARLKTNSGVNAQKFAPVEATKLKTGTEQLKSDKALASNAAVTKVKPKPTEKSTPALVKKKATVAPVRTEMSAKATTTKPMRTKTKTRKTEEAKPSVKKFSAKSNATRARTSKTVKPKAAPEPKVANTVRVYGPDGNPIN